MSDPTYVVCPTCGSDRFLQARRFYTLKLEDGTVQRNWAVGAEDSSEMVCAHDATRLRWNRATQTFDVVPKP
ncbi:MAG TPA: hypothetical protein VGQ44_01530 [Gemmatimonadaceae bacterium]|jgi:hypothetical protein|nr:hypothetical protein [Gemmatimonadaceae bacterium]